MLEKKRGVFLTSTINWHLYSNNELVIDLNNVPAFYKKDEYLEFWEDDINNTIDIKNKLYIRKSKDYKMTIDFSNNICYFILPKEGELSINIEGKLIINHRKIVIEYSYGENKKIEIEIKE